MKKASEVGWGYGGEAASCRHEVTSRVCAPRAFQAGDTPEIRRDKRCGPPAAHAARWPGRLSAITDTADPGRVGIKDRVMTLAV